jgi:hypothetical protein
MLEYPSIQRSDARIEPGNQAHEAATPAIWLELLDNFSAIEFAAMRNQASYGWRAISLRYSTQALPIGTTAKPWRLRGDDP